MISLQVSNLLSHPQSNEQNCSTTESLKRLGQLLTLGNFPSHILPFVFSWPPGTELSYLLAKKAGADERTKNCFVQFVRDLKAAGVGKIHLLSHSAGCGVVVGFLERFGEVFEEVGGGWDGEEGREKVKLCSFTMSNADVSAWICLISFRILSDGW